MKYVIYVLKKSKLQVFLEKCLHIYIYIPSISFLVKFTISLLNPSYTDTLNTSVIFFYFLELFFFTASD